MGGLADPSPSRQSPTPNPTCWSSSCGRKDGGSLSLRGGAHRCSAVRGERPGRKGLCNPPVQHVAWLWEEGARPELG